MHFWLVTVGEPLPTDNDNPRLLRTALFAKKLLELGHEVDWWSSTFDHNKKTHRTNKSTTLSVTEKYRIHLLHGPAYRKNISLARIKNHQEVAKEFLRRCKTEKAPDAIVCSMPTFELAEACTQYGKVHGVPVVVDMRDLWPDIFASLAPGALKPVAKLALKPWYATLRRASQNASAIWGISPEFVEWGLSYAQRERTKWDEHFWLAHHATRPADAEIEKAHAFWKEHGIDAANPGFVASFAGVLSSKLDLDPVLTAAKILKNQNCKFVICGSGDLLARAKKETSGLSNVIFPGWVNNPQIWTLLRLSSVGLAPYHSREDFVLSVPTKAIEYLSAGLPVLSSLQGSLANLLQETNAGITYQNGNGDALAKLIVDLMQSTKMRDDLSKNALRLFEERFTGEKVFAKMAQSLESLSRSDAASL